MRNENTSIRLKKIMADKGLKQADILNKCKPICERYNKMYNMNIQITKSDLSQWISGVYEPRQNKLTVLAEALGTNEVWLMGFDVPNVPKDEYNSSVSKEKEKEMLKDVLKRKGFLNDNEEMTEEDFNRLIEFAKQIRNLLCQIKTRIFIKNILD